MFTLAADLGARVRGGELSARELVQASLDRIESLDGELNAFVEVDADRALAAAAEIEPGDERPFAGVPIAVKANVPVEGMCMNFGSKFLEGHRPDHSAYLVRRLREAGFVVVGITNMPEFGILPTTEPRHTGATRNPVGHGAHARRLLRRLGGGRGGRDGAARARQRRRRLDPHPGRLLRPRRPQAQPRPHLQGTRPRRHVPGQ
jgi:amidase